MTKINASFQKQCEQNKTSDYAVIVTLLQDFKRLKSCSIDPVKFQPIVGIPSVFKAVLNGDEILELYQCAEVESVDQDQEFGILN